MTKTSTTCSSSGGDGGGTVESSNTTSGPTTASEQEPPEAAAALPDFVAEELSPKERDEAQLQLDTFVVHHSLTHCRPIALVSSGGTACDLELNAVRTLENFSTGTRGAASVEEFLKRGYAVVHLKRKGSSCAAPFARVLSEELSGNSTDGISSYDCLHRLFAIEGEGDGDGALGALDDDEALVQQVLRQDREQQRQLRRNHNGNGNDDPFLTDPSYGGDNYGADPALQTGSANGGSSHLGRSRRAKELVLRRGIANSASILAAMRQCASAVKQNRLLTLEFRTVEQYLALLQLSTCALRDCHSLAVLYLAAAVSDFYIPRNERHEHKIQSSSGEDVGGLTLHLKPVPKTLGLVRTEWAPNAFVVSFKLETDMGLLRTKSERAVNKYGCHMVIGNILQTRHDKVWVLCPEYYQNADSTDAASWPDMTELTKSRSGSSSDSLESVIIDFVVQSHFEYISCHFQHQQASLISSRTRGDDDQEAKSAPPTAQEIRSAAGRARALLEEKKRRIQRQRLFDQIQSISVDVAGMLLAVGLSYMINTAIQRRLRP